MPYAVCDQCRHVFVIEREERAQQCRECRRPLRVIAREQARTFLSEPNDSTSPQDVRP